MTPALPAGNGGVQYGLKWWLYPDPLAPGQFVLVDQFIDRTVARSGESTFFGRGIVAHVQFADPFCPVLSRALVAAARQAGAMVHEGGTYVCMEGPQFSTRAESNLYRSWGCDVIGMTNMPEAKLAREAELCYATVAMVTDYDCWHPNHDDVSVEAIVKLLVANADKARALIRAVAPRLHADAAAGDCVCRSALQHALITAPEARDPEVLARLDAVAGRLLHAEGKP